MSDPVDPRTTNHHSWVFSIIALARKLFYNTWIHRLPITNKLYVWLLARGRTNPTDTVTFRGATFTIATHDITIYPSLVNGVYETAELDFMSHYLANNKRNDVVMVDIGANVGIFTVLASKAMQNRGKIFAFEPVAANFAMLQTNVAHNQVTNAILTNKALGPKEGTMDIFMEKNSIGTHSLLPNGTGQQTSKVAVTTLDIFFKNIPHIDFLKIDVERFEYHVLSGAMQTLPKIDTMLLEISKDTDQHDALISLLQQHFPNVQRFAHDTLIPSTFAEVRTLPYANLILSR